MIWLAWRQSRAQIVLALGLLCALAAAYLATGPGLARLYDSSGLAACHAADGCPALVNTFMSQMKADAIDPFLYFLGFGAVLLAPALIGAFWGAPLLTREVEGGTLRLAWSQSVTRTRWILVRLAVAGGAGIAVTGLLSWLITWWAGPIDRAGGFPAGGAGEQLSRFSPQVFDARGVAPLGYAALAFTLGLAAGMLIRRTVPAMAVALTAFALLQYAVASWIRPHLYGPLRLVSAPLDTTELGGFVMNHNGQLTLPVNLPGAWIVSNRTVTPGGGQFVLPMVPACQSGTQQQCLAWLGSRHLRQAVTYYPADRFWDFQWTETAGYLAIALVLAGACVLWIRRGSAI